MDTSIVFSKTTMGEQAITTRDADLDRKSRLVLILVDGHSDIDRLRAKVAGIEDLESALEKLALAGFIEADNKEWQPLSSSAPPDSDADTDASFDAQAVKGKLIDAAILVLGSDAEKVVNMLRDAPDTLEGLEEAILRCKKIVDLTIDEERAAELKQKCLAIIGKM